MYLLQISQLLLLWRIGVTTGTLRRMAHQNVPGWREAIVDFAADWRIAHIAVLHFLAKRGFTWRRNGAGLMDKMDY